MQKLPIRKHSPEYEQCVGPAVSLHFHVPWLLRNVKLLKNLASENNMSLLAWSPFLWLSVTYFWVLVNYFCFIYTSLSFLWLKFFLFLSFLLDSRNIFYKNIFYINFCNIILQTIFIRVFISSLIYGRAFLDDL